MTTTPSPSLVGALVIKSASTHLVSLASKCDDISCSEVIRALRLEDDPVLEDIEDRLTTSRHDISECKRRKSTAEKEVKGIRKFFDLLTLILTIQTRNQGRA